MDKKSNIHHDNELYRDLLDFKETKESISELLKIKRSHVNQEGSDAALINEIKDKAMHALDHLFSDDPELEEGK
jgi:predicted CopG family antitoxin